MFIPFIPVASDGRPHFDEVVVVNVDNVTHMQQKGAAAGWSCRGLVLEFTSGKSQRVYVAATTATDEDMQDRFAFLDAALRGGVRVLLTDPLFALEDETWKPGDTV